MVRSSSLVAVAAVLLSAAASGQGAVYRWVDAEGVTHYTDVPGSIPKGVEVFATEGEPISEMGRAPAVAPPKLAQQEQEKRVEEKRVEIQPEVPSGSERYWRGEFRAAREKISGLEDAIAADKHRVDDVGGLPVQYACHPGYLGYPAYGSVPGYGANFNAGYANYYGGGCYTTVNPEWERSKERLEKNRKALERAKEELHDLERRASFEAVPNEWRR